MAVEPDQWAGYRHVLRVTISRAARVRSARPTTILHVENNTLVSGMVKDTLEMEGWAVDVCGDGAEALRKIVGGADYNLLILDHALPGMLGMELIRRVQELEHCRCRSSCSRRATLRLRRVLPEQTFF